jgi:hypothetical protein
MKLVDRDDWLEIVPLEGTFDQDPPASLHFSALLTAATNESIRLLVGDVLLEIDLEDVVEMHELNNVPDDAMPRFGRWVQVAIRRASRLLAMERAEATRSGATLGRIPFAFATRLEQPEVPPSKKYEGLTRAYLRRHGLLGEHVDSDTRTSG